jgi:RNA polymerase sigma-70 factor (ECF subfamily)
MHASELARLYDAHAPALFAFLLNFTRDESCTRDVLQEVFLRLARRPDLLAGVRDERAFLLRLAHNLAVDWLRRLDARRRTHAALAGEAVELFVAGPDTDDPDVQRQISSALGELPPEQRAVLQLKLWEGLTFDEIAQLLDISLNTAASRYRYALGKLRARLRSLYEELH